MKASRYALLDRWTIHEPPLGSANQTLKQYKSTDIFYTDLSPIKNTCWIVRGSNPGEGEIFRTRPDRSWGPPSLLYNVYGFFPRGKSGRGVALTTHPYLAPRLKKEQSYTSTPPLDLRGLFYSLKNVQVNYTSTIR